MAISVTTKPRFLSLFYHFCGDFDRRSLKWGEFGQNLGRRRYVEGRGGIHPRWLEISLRESARGFESPPLRQTKIHPIGWIFVCGESKRGFERNEQNNPVSCFANGDRRFLRNVTKDKIQNVEQKSRTNPSLVKRLGEKFSRRRVPLSTLF